MGWFIDWWLIIFGVIILMGEKLLCFILFLLLIGWFKVFIIWFNKLWFIGIFKIWFVYFVVIFFVKFV